MKPISKLIAYIAPIALAILIGCGGGSSPKSGGPGGTPSSLTRDQLKSGYSHTLLALAQAGAFPAAGVVSGTSGSSGGGGGASVPYIGAFVRQFAPGGSGPMARVHSREVGTTGTSGGGTGGTDGGGGGTEPTFYFDEYLGLWVEWVSTDTSYTMTLFVDEAKSQPAGSFVTTYAGADGDFSSTFEITAGTQAGAHGTYTSTVKSDGTCVSKFDNTWPQWGHDEGESTWGPETSTWSYRNESTDGSWFESHGTFNANGSGSNSSSDSKGFRYAFIYNSDGSGNGTVEGPEPGLPAQISWLPNGHTTIVWADGTVEEFDPYLWIDEGGTTGSGTGGSTGDVPVDSTATGSGTSGSSGGG